MGKDFNSKTYILDTNILLQSPFSIYAFDEHNVVLADITLEELDIMKSTPGQKGLHAIEVSRILKETINYENMKNKKMV